MANKDANRWGRAVGLGSISRRSVGGVGNILVVMSELISGKNGRVHLYVLTQREALIGAKFLSDARIGGVVGWTIAMRVIVVIVFT